MKKTEDGSQPMIAWGRDEMNLVELPFGPITPTSGKTLEVVHPVFDPILKRKVTRKTIITGSDAFGLPRPIDDLVLIGMMALTQEDGFQSPRVQFSIYQLCRIIGWPIDGRSYKRVESSISRIAGTTLQFKDAWYDKGDKEFKSKTFHLIDEADLRSRDQMDRARRRKHSIEPGLSSFVWNQVIWKSFQDGFIRRLDMEMFRTIAKGRRRDVPIRLFRILDKRFHRRSKAKFGVDQLAVGILGLSPHYAPSQMRRIIDRAAQWLVQCGYLAEYRYCQANGSKLGAVVFQKSGRHTSTKGRLLGRGEKNHCSKSNLRNCDRSADRHWFLQRSEAELRSLEDRALEACYGSELVRRLVQEERGKGKEVASSGALRRSYVKRFAQSTTESDKHLSSAIQAPK